MILLGRDRGWGGERRGNIIGIQTGRVMGVKCGVRAGEGSGKQEMRHTAKGMWSRRYACKCVRVCAPMKGQVCAYEWYNAFHSVSLHNVDLLVTATFTVKFLTFVQVTHLKNITLLKHL